MELFIPVILASLFCIILGIVFWFFEIIFKPKPDPNAHTADDKTDMTQGINIKKKSLGARMIFIGFIMLMVSGGICFSTLYIRAI